MRMTATAIAGLCLIEAAFGGSTAFPLRVSSDGRFLLDRNGIPFFINGDTPWSLTHNLTYEEAVRYIEDRERKGINALILSIPDAYGPDGTHLDPPDRYGNYPFLDRDLTRPVEAYWLHVDRVLDKCRDAGMLVLFFPAYLGCCEDGYLKLLQDNGAEKALAYGRWIGTRYRRFPNLLWVHGGDRKADDVQELVQAVKDGISEIGSGQLQTVHWAPETDPWSPFGENWTDLYSAYTYGPVASRVQLNYDHLPVKPVFLIETHYENDFGKKTAEDTRKYPYRALLSGAAGHFFGNRPLWFCGYGWEQELDSPGSRYLQIAGEFIRSIPWHQLVPDRDHKFVVEGFGDSLSDDGVQAAVTTDRKLAVAYLPTPRPIRITPSTLSEGDRHLRWFNPRNGSFQDGSLPENEGIVTLEPPGDGDWILVVAVPDAHHKP